MTRVPEARSRLPSNAGSESALGLDVEHAAWRLPQGIGWPPLGSSQWPPTPRPRASLAINELASLTDEVVDAARETLVIGSS